MLDVKELIELRFMKNFINFEITLRRVLSLLQEELHGENPRIRFGSAQGMWQWFSSLINEKDTARQYNTKVSNIVSARNKYVHGAGAAYTAEDFADLIDQIEEVSAFIQKYEINHAPLSDSLGYRVV